MYIIIEFNHNKNFKLSLIRKLYSSMGKLTPNVNFVMLFLPTAGSASPSLGGRKEYRKVAYEGSALQRGPSQVGDFGQCCLGYFNVSGQ